MKTHVADTSVEAMQRISESPDHKKLGDLIVDVIAAAQRRGAIDMSMREVQDALYTYHGRKADMSSISPQVNRLVECGRLVRNKEFPRPCTVSGVHIAALHVPVFQTRLVA